jgi:hypothetical protein
MVLNSNVVEPEPHHFVVAGGSGSEFNVEHWPVSK